jgi:hypothetical protein
MESHLVSGGSVLVPGLNDLVVIQSEPTWL